MSLSAAPTRQLACSGCHRKLSRHLCNVTRRQASTALLLSGAAAVARPPHAQALPPPRPSTCAPLDPALAKAFLEAVYSTVEQQQILPVEQLQRERFKLQAQEYPYFLAANKERLPALPDLSDQSGGLSNPVYYNFISYILWKTVAKHLPTPEQRTAFCSGVGEALLQQLAPELPQQLQQQRAAAARASPGVGPPQQAPAAASLEAVDQLLKYLKKRGFICSYQLVMGSLPGSWPGDWATSEPQLVDAEEVLSQRTEPFAAGTVFQLKLQQPADIEGAVALRSEEDGFWSRHISSLISALLRSGGYSPVVDEYFSQDAAWRGPQSAGGKLLLLLGDPLNQVDVPWDPDTLVQNWTLV